MLRSSPCPWLRTHAGGVLFGPRIAGDSLSEADERDHRRGRHFNSNGRQRLMKPNTLRLIGHTLAGGMSAVACMAILLLAPRASSQTTGPAPTEDKPTWPTTFTLGFGGLANGNWQGSGTY